MRTFGRAAAGLLLAAAFFSSCSSSKPENVIILCAGDSLTEFGYPPHLRRLLQKDGVRARVHNLGRSGNTSGEYLRYLNSAEAGLKTERPDFILLQLGTNDVRLDGDRTSVADFEDNMRRVIGVFAGFKDRAGRPSRILLALVPPVPDVAGYPFSPESSARVEEEINPLIRRLAGELALDLVDNHTLFREAPGLLPDVHPTEDGYRRMAAVWYAALKPRLPG